MPVRLQPMLTVAAFYKFENFPDFADYRARLLAACEEGRVKGTILLASEGVNGTICGPAEGIDKVLDALRQLPGFSDLEHRRSHASKMAFKRLKVRLKKEIVTIGLPNLDAARDAGIYVGPEEWNDLIADDEVAVIDTRNDQEVAIGSFEKAIDPKTASFREFPDWLKSFKQEQGAKKLAMFCTGGIRCEKATAFARSISFDEVYHLEGGILNYLEKIPVEQSKWQGDCYVFDHRVSVRHGLEEGGFDQCHACGRPVAPADKENEHYIEGVSCNACWDVYSDDQKARFAERQRQCVQAQNKKGRA
ncbi:MAG: rhodanese-related sulfurtransferase [Geminicoccaceae bacterium]